MTRTETSFAGSDPSGLGKVRPTANQPGLAEPIPQPLPLNLPHPLELFGEECAVKGCVSVGLPDPDAMVRIFYGHGLESLIRHFEPGKHHLLRQVRYWEEQRHEPTATTKRLIAQMMEPFHSFDEVMEMSPGRPSALKQRFLPWRTMAKAIKSTTTAPVANNAFYDVASHLSEREAFYARLKHHERAGRKSPERAYLEIHLPPAIASWRQLNPTLCRDAFWVIEEALHGIAHFEVRWAQPSIDVEPLSRVTGLITPARRPLGLWLQEVAQASRAGSLVELQDVLFRQDARHKKRHIGLDLLKKWSASRQMLLPIEAVEPLLSAVRDKQESQKLEGRYLLARLLTYLTALVRAGTAGEPPIWQQAQRQIESRYTEVYRLHSKSTQTSC